MLAFTQDKIRPIRSISIEDITSCKAQQHLLMHKEPVLFLKKDGNLFGYIRTENLSHQVIGNEETVHVNETQIIPIHNIYNIYILTIVPDIFKLLGEEIVIVRNKNDHICGYLKREDILLELIQQGGDLDFFDYIGKIFSSIPLGFFIINEQNIIINYNNAGLRMIKMNDIEMQNIKASEIFDSNHVEHVFATAQPLLNQISIKNNVEILADYNPIFDTNHELKGMVIVIQDLPKIQGISMELEYVKNLNRDLHALLSTVFDDEILVVNNEGIIIRLNDNFISDIWGTTDPNDIIGKSVFEFESKGIFKPSITRIVLERKTKVTIIQETKVGKTLLTIGNPIFNDEGNIDRIVIAARDITETSRLKNELNEAKKLSANYKKELDDIKNRDELNRKMIYRSKKMDVIMKEVEKIAKFSSTILLTGESGVGKEVIAKSIHQLGSRVNQPFIKINCGAIPENLLESELFGYVKGAFTGANPKGNDGYFKQANRGILFLDEISELPLNLQVKLLRVLQEREVISIGSSKAFPIDVQIIAATNRNLEQQVEDGLFREDLYYRLNVIPIQIPALRERIEDIAPLAYHFIQKLNKQYNRSNQISPDALNLLEIYPWPGNVRELQNVIERVMVVTDEEIITASQIKTFLNWKKSTSKIRPTLSHIVPLNEALENVEEQLILMAMEQYRTTTLAAKMLGISQSSMSRKYQSILANRNKAR
jgi:transcriptional regulator with PAS, ATPase and Fis domain